MIIPRLLTSRSSASAAIDNLKEIIASDGIWRPGDDASFVFLCGGNIDKKTPSRRRKMVMDFARKNLKHTEIFLAEKVFEVLEAEGHKKNILDVESDISEFADKIIIILESESAFCELGAFAVDLNKRGKIIVINNVKYKEDSSFINMGPILAINETASSSNLLYYKMKKDGKTAGDGIGSIFKQLHSLLDTEVRKRNTRVEEYNPTKYFNKDSIRFMHDLVYLMGPLYFHEISIIVKKLFGPHQKRQIRNQLALLGAIDQIESTKGLFRSKNKSCYFIYKKLDPDAYVATFKNMYYRYAEDRLA